MFRLTTLALTILCLLTTLSCQSYSSGLEKTVAVADETAVTGTLHTIALAQQSYATANSGAYGTFAELAAGGFLDSRFSAEKPRIKDYAFTMEVGKDAGGPSYKCSADPSDSAVRPGRHFQIDSTSDKVHVNPTQPASASDPAL
ncbi:MAG TPA: hypothetical protein VLL54_17295 [Pyrinomonadaceae bacterium]|nr:hypothetical protein [Pyrinomonadaceae bacterium]